MERRRCPRSWQSGVHLAVGVLVGGLLGATAGLMAGMRQSMDTHVLISERSALHHADQPQLSSGGRADRDDDDCTSDPRVAYPLLGIVVGTIVGLGAAQAFGLSGAKALRRATRSISNVTGQ